MKLPDALAEQQRVVARIEKLAAQIHEARTLRQRASEATDKLIDRTKFSIFESNELGRYRFRLGDADVVISRESRNPSAGRDQSFMYVDISTVGFGPSVLTNGRKIPKEEAPSRARRVIQKDDLLISTVRPNLRVFGKVGASLDGQICSTGFAVITCGSSIVPDFLLHQCCSPFFVDQCMALVTGGHYPAINDTNLRNVEIICPPLQEQRRVVAELDTLQMEVDALKHLQAETAAELDALLPAILDRAFKGEL